MKIASDLTNTKADKAIKLANLLAANHRHVQHEGKVYKIAVEKLGWMILASATHDEPEINLFDTSKLAREIRTLCENRLYS